ncbi:hypothetical protein H0H93_001994 [Arthromyces matolae]|nr:hypothetical protein H0H93_001994 [Arthromyces matolae]
MEAYRHAQASRDTVEVILSNMSLTCPFVIQAGFEEGLLSHQRIVQVLHVYLPVDLKRIKKRSKRLGEILEVLSPYPVAFHTLTGSLPPTLEDKYAAPVEILAASQAARSWLGYLFKQRHGLELAKRGMSRSQLLRYGLEVDRLWPSQVTYCSTFTVGVAAMRDQSPPLFKVEGVFGVEITRLWLFARESRGVNIFSLKNLVASTTANSPYTITRCETVLHTDETMCPPKVISRCNGTDNVQRFKGVYLDPALPVPWSANIRGYTEHRLPSDLYRAFCCLSGCHYTWEPSPPQEKKLSSPTKSFPAPDTDIMLNQCGKMNAASGSGAAEILVFWSSNPEEALSKGDIDCIPAFATVAHYSNVAVALESMSVAGEFIEQTTRQGEDGNLQAPVVRGKACPARKSVVLSG